MSQVQKVFIKPGGSIVALHKDETAGALRAIGKSTIVRASHVEPDPSQDGTWVVDLAPSGGPKQGGFATYKEAIDWEVKWLNDRQIPIPPH